MKKLFLASYFAFVKDLLPPLLPDQPHKLKLAFIPTAAYVYVVKPWFDEDLLALKLLGFALNMVDLKNKTESDLLNELHDCQALFVSGGNTYYLLEHAQKSGFIRIAQTLVDSGVVYIGSSAGSVLASPTIEHIEDLDDASKATLDSYQSLGLIRERILPHAGEPKYRENFSRIMRNWQNDPYPIQPLRNDEVVLVDGSKQQVVSNTKSVRS